MNLMRAFVPTLPAPFADAQHDLTQTVWPSPEPPRPHIGLLVLFGPEVRAFLHSGLAERLSRYARVSLITTNPESAALSTLAGPEVHAAPVDALSRPLGRVRGWNRRFHDAWLRSQGQARWRHEVGPPAPSDLLSPGALALNSGLRWLRTAHLVERSLARLCRDGEGWRRLYERLGLDCVVAGDYASPAAAMALLAAAHSNVATVVLTNSWKDVYAHPYADVPPGWIGVPGEAEADYLRRSSPHLIRDRVAVTGSLHLERFLRPAAIPSRAEFCGRAGLDSARPFLCYTAASPRAVLHEELIVRGMLETIARHPAQPQVLLRLNPREDGARFQALVDRFSDCVVQRPRWEWDAQNDWNAPLPEDLDTWVATVHHAALNVSIPSTVTLEFGAIGRLTLNVCFDAEPQPPQASNARFWDAPFYRQIRKSPLVAGAFSSQEFRELLLCRLSEPGAWELSPPRRVASPVEEAEKLIACALAAQRLKGRSRWT